jgi:two-component system, chemotaxis family, chemotaxis protein CheY
MHNSITVRLPDAMIQSIDEICKKQESSRQEVIRTALSLMLFNDHRNLESNPSHPGAPNISDSKVEHVQGHISSEDLAPRFSALVIEDDSDMKDVFVEILQMYNISVIGTGSNGKEAVELYGKLHPDIVFMDILMPAYDGFDGIKAIKKIDPSAKIVIVTGAVLDPKKMPFANTTQMVQKPVDMKNIISAVNKIMV